MANKTLGGKDLTIMEVDSFIQYQMDSLQITGLSIAIVENGRIVYYKATGIKNFKHDSVDTNTLFEAGSMTKPVFAYAVHKLIEENVLNLYASEFLWSKHLLGLNIITQAILIIDII
jgi:CubicO group peptidase (beta-lactamase class C family)